MTNARTALSWMSREVPNPTNHVVAVSNSVSNPKPSVFQRSVFLILRIGLEEGTRFGALLDYH